MLAKLYWDAKAFFYIEKQKMGGGKQGQVRGSSEQKLKISTCLLPVFKWWSFL